MLFEGILEAVGAHWEGSWRSVGKVTGKDKRRPGIRSAYETEIIRIGRRTIRNWLWHGLLTVPFSSTEGLPQAANPSPENRRDRKPEQLGFLGRISLFTILNVPVRGSLFKLANRLV